MRVANYPIAVLAFCLTACTTTVTAEEPARLVKPDLSTSTAVRHAIEKELQRNSIPLAGDALTQTSLLIIEPARVRDQNGARLQGRETRMPERFRLLKKGEVCLLLHENNGARLALDNVACVTEK